MRILFPSVCRLRVFWVRRRYKQIFWVSDTCQAATLQNQHRPRSTGWGCWGVEGWWRCGGWGGGVVGEGLGLGIGWATSRQTSEKEPEAAKIDPKGTAGRAAVCQAVEFARALGRRAAPLRAAHLSRRQPHWGSEKLWLTLRGARAKVSIESWSARMVVLASPAWPPKTTCSATWSAERRK